MKYDCFLKKNILKHYRFVPETDYCLLTVFSRFYDKVYKNIKIDFDT